MMARCLLDVSSQSSFLFPKQRIVVMFDAQNCELGSLVPAFWYPGGSLWYLGETLGDRGSSRKDLRRFVVDILFILGRFVGPILKAFWVPRAKFSFLVSSFPNHFSKQLSCSNRDAWSS